MRLADPGLKLVLKPSRHNVMLVNETGSSVLFGDAMTNDCLYHLEAGCECFVCPPILYMAFEAGNASVGKKHYTRYHPEFDSMKKLMAGLVRELEV